MTTQRQRIIITMNETTLNELKVQAQRMGVSTNAYVNFVVGQHLNAQTQMMNKVEEIITKAIEQHKVE